MQRRFLIMMLVLALAAGALVLAGCGSKEAEQPAAQQATEQPAAAQPAAEQPAAEHPAAEHPAAEPAGDAAVAVHDCAGGCGMTNVPQDQMTEVDGKWYCAGCAKQAQEHAGHGHG